MNKNTGEAKKLSAGGNPDAKRRGIRALIFPAEPLIAIAMLLFAIGFNLYLYRLEPTAKVDPNDNTFQFALVYRTNQIWNFAEKKCSVNVICFFSYLADHWVPNWNEGYNLPYYYSHIPQIVIVGAYRMLAPVLGISLFSFYHLVIYLLLCFFPLSVFLGLWIAGFSPLTAGLGAMLASQVSTDGLYGLDPPSFLWRGYGLSSQLFAMIWLPLAIAYAYKFFTSGEYKKYIFPSVLFLVFTTAGHLGIGMIAFMSLVPLAYAEPILQIFTSKFSFDLFKKQTIKILLLAVPAVFFLSYWIVPAMANDKFHNFSFWDPVWKFNSYGWKETVIRLFNGDLFDFGRIPIYTGLIIIGLFASLFVIRNSPFVILFIFWFILYFGRTTWGGLLDLVPGLKEFHQSRFIVGIHLAGFFLAPIGLAWLVSRITYHVSRFFNNDLLIRLFVYSSIGLLLLIPIYRQTVQYNDHNNVLIKRANGNYDADISATNKLLQTIQTLPPARIFAGRGGSWGRDFKIAETPMYMYLSNFAVPSVLWLPETWSPNGDTEQYFREDHAEDYNLYNIRWVVTPANIAKENVQPFWRLIKEHPSWKLYEVPTSGYFTTGVIPAIVAADKYSRTNVVRLWIQSEDHRKGLYPQLTFDTQNFPRNFGLPNFKMLDEVTYVVPNRSTHNLFAEPPKYIADTSVLSKIIISDEKADSDMIFSATVAIPKNCTECLIVLKQSYHPGWKATVDGHEVKPIIVFPFYLAVPISEGTHEIVFSYQPSGVKLVLLYIELFVLALFIGKTLFHIKLRFPVFH